MDILNEELLKFWKSLNTNNVEYIMVGGFAVYMHGYIRTTNHIDIWIKDDVDNRRNLGRAMSIFGYSSLSWDVMQFVPGWTNFHIGAGVMLDIMTTMKGLENVSFEMANKMASIAEIEGVNVPFLHINQLIENKKVVNRPKDQVDVIELEKIKLLRKDMGID